MMAGFHCCWMLVLVVPMLSPPRIQVMADIFNEDEDGEFNSIQIDVLRLKAEKISCKIRLMARPL